MDGVVVGNIAHKQGLYVVKKSHHWSISTRLFLTGRSSSSAAALEGRLNRSPLNPAKSVTCALWYSMTLLFSSKVERTGGMFLVRTEDGLRSSV